MWEMSGGIRVESFIQLEGELGAGHAAKELGPRALLGGRLHHLAYDSHQVLGQLSLGNVAGGARLQRADGDFLAPHRGHQDYRQMGARLLDVLDQGQAVHLGHLKIGEHQVGRGVLDGGDGLDAVFAELHRDAPLFREKSPRQPAIHGRVVHHQNFRHRFVPCLLKLRSPTATPPRGR
jgi:hypothetical protein